MAVAVVDLLEAVEIAEQQAAGIGVLDLQLQLLHQAQAIGQAGDRILARQL
ncbi:hypothetical protein D3C86_2249100 [compost metagenome]